MLKIIVIFLGVVIGVCLFLGLLVFSIWLKIKGEFRKLGFSNLNVRKMIKEEIAESKSREETPKSISGATRVIMPYIIRDFPEFNENLLFNMTEEGIRSVFLSLNEMNSSYASKFPMLKNNVEKIILENKKNRNIVNYRDVKFHKFSIKDYNKISGVATITVATSLEYYFRKNENDTEKKIQSRFSCKFIYIYNEDKFKEYEMVKVLSCPSCGAAIESLGQKKCKYCGSAIIDINLKAWEFASYEEY